MVQKCGTDMAGRAYVPSGSNQEKETTDRLPPQGSGRGERLFTLHLNLYLCVLSGHVSHVILVVNWLMWSLLWPRLWIATCFWSLSMLSLNFSPCDTVCTVELSHRLVRFYFYFFCSPLGTSVLLHQPIYTVAYVSISLLLIGVCFGNQPFR